MTLCNLRKSEYHEELHVSLHPAKYHEAMSASTWSLPLLWVDPLALLALLTLPNDLKSEQMNCTVILQSLFLCTINLRVEHSVSHKKYPYFQKVLTSSFFLLLYMDVYCHVYNSMSG
jgi:hypothetical protein